MAGLRAAPRHRPAAGPRPSPGSHRSHPRRPTRPPRGAIRRRAARQPPPPPRRCPRGGAARSRRTCRRRPARIAAGWFGRRTWWLTLARASLRAATAGARSARLSSSSTPETPARPPGGQPMTTIRRRAPMLMLSLAIAATAVLTPPLRTAAAVPAETRRPNLQMVRLHDWHVENVGGRRLLRFSTIFVNPGPRALRAARRRARRAATRPWRSTRSCTARTAAAPPHARRPFAKYAGDGHDHWHVQNVVTYEAWALGDLQASRRGRQDRFLLLRHHPVEPLSCRTRARRLLPAGVVRHRGLPDQPRRRLRRLGGRLSRGTSSSSGSTSAGCLAVRYRVRATVDIHDNYRETDRARQLRVERGSYPGARARAPP